MNVIPEIDSPPESTMAALPVRNWMNHNSSINVATLVAPVITSVSWARLTAGLGQMVSTVIQRKIAPNESSSTG